MFCARSNSYIFIEHRELQNRDDLYEDHIHINKFGGVRSLVQDIHRAFNDRHRNSNSKCSVINKSHSFAGPVFRPAPPPTRNAWNTGPPSINGNNYSQPVPSASPQPVQTYQQGPPMNPPNHVRNIENTTLSQQSPGVGGVHPVMDSSKVNGCGSNGANNIDTKTGADDLIRLLMIKYFKQ